MVQKKILLGTIISRRYSLERPIEVSVKAEEAHVLCCSGGRELNLDMLSQVLITGSINCAIYAIMAVGLDPRVRVNKNLKLCSWFPLFLGGIPRLVFFGRIFSIQLCHHRGPYHFYHVLRWIAL